MLRRSPACHFLTVLGLTLGLLFMLAVLIQQQFNPLDRLMKNSTRCLDAGGQMPVTGALQSSAGLGDVQSLTGRAADAPASSLLVDHLESADIPLAEPASAAEPAPAGSQASAESPTTAISAESDASPSPAVSPEPAATPTPDVSPAPTVNPVSDVSPTPAAGPAPAISTAQATVRKPTAARTATPTTVSSAPSGTAQATVSTDSSGRLIVPFYYVGERIGTIKIPSVGISVSVYQGDSPDILEKGAGHYMGSFLPGQRGNIVIPGHRVQSVFRNFEYLRAGATISFNTTYGSYSYRVTAFKVIDSQDESIVRETSREQLTLYTCYPFDYIGLAPQRYVVICERA